MSFSSLRRIWPSTLLCAIVVVLSFAFPLPTNGKIFNLGSPCAFFNLTNIPCPGCGLTRSFVSTAHGHISQAFVWHPLGPILFGITLAYVLWSFWMIYTRKTVRFSQRVQLGAYGSIAILMLLSWALRLSGTFPLPS